MERWEDNTKTWEQPGQNYGSAAPLSLSPCDLLKAVELCPLCYFHLAEVSEKKRMEDPGILIWFHLDIPLST